MNRKHTHRNGLILASFVCALSLVLGTNAQAAYKIGDDESYLKIGGLLQGWITTTEDAAPSGDSWDSEFYVRRMRLMFYGQINKWVNFFIETDNPNFGKNGDLSMNTFIQDAYLEFNIHEMLQIDIGMLLVPFSHHGMQGATSLLGLDYHGPLVKYPGGSTKVWRDYGVMFRGMLFGKWLEYRLGLFNGVRGNLGPMDMAGEGYQVPQDPRNDSDWPRLTARLTFNVFEPEGGAGVGGMFYDGLYIKKTDIGIVSTKRVLSFGASLDWQRDINVTMDDAPVVTGVEPEPPLRGVSSRSDYLAAAADAFWDIPLDAQKLWSLNGQVNFYYYGYGDRSDGDTWYDVAGDTKSFTGVGLATEVGVRYDAFQPVVLFDWYTSLQAVDGATGDYMGIYGGFNYWLFGHSTSLKIQFGANKVNDGDFALAGAFQAQLLF